MKHRVYKKNGNSVRGAAFVLMKQGEVLHSEFSSPVTTKRMIHLLRFLGYESAGDLKSAPWKRWFIAVDPEKDMYRPMRFLCADGFEMRRSGIKQNRRARQIMKLLMTGGAYEG